MLFKYPKKLLLVIFLLVLSSSSLPSSSPSSSSSTVVSILLQSLEFNPVTQESLSYSNHDFGSQANISTFEKGPVKKILCNDPCHNSPFWARVVRDLKGFELNFLNFLNENFCDIVLMEKICQKHRKKIQSKNEEKQINAFSENHFDYNCAMFMSFRSHRKVVTFSPLTQPPFCSYAWSIDVNTQSWWDFIPTKCRINVIIFYVICGILAVATTLSNVTVLIVLFTNKKRMNGQAVYRISLAISNLIVGVIIFPTFISTNIKHVNDILFLQFSSATSYTNAVGFFLVSSYHVSIFTLMAAAFDRFKALYRPWKYDACSSVVLARKICLGTWAISIALAIVPLGVFDEYFRYMSFYGTFVMPFTLDSIHAYTFYSIFVISIPLVTMWIFTILTFVLYVKYSKQRQQIISTSRHKHLRLLLTTGIMMGVFSLCSLPTVLAHAAELVAPSKSSPSANVIVVAVLLTNCFWNFFIYSVRDAMFRNTLKNIFKQFSSQLK